MTEDSLKVQLAGLVVKVDQLRQDVQQIEKEQRKVNDLVIRLETIIPEIRTCITSVEAKLTTGLAEQSKRLNGYMKDLVPINIKTQLKTTILFWVLMTASAAAIVQGINRLFG